MIEQGAGWWGVPTPERKDVRNFAFVMSVAAAIVAGILWYNDSVQGMQIAGAVAGVFLAAGLLFPMVLKPLFVVWMGIARVLAFVNTHLILALVFYSLFTVIGLVMRLLGRDPLDRKLSPTAKTYWHRREKPLLDRAHYERQF